MKTFISLIGSFLIFLLLNNAYAEKAVSPESVKGATTIDVAKAKALFDKKVLFIDVRSDKDWAEGRIPGAVHINLKKGFSNTSLAKKVKKSDAVVIYCNGSNCLRSSKATAKAVSWGFSKVNYFRLGFPAWKTAGYITE